MKFVITRLKHFITTVVAVMFSFALFSQETAKTKVSTDFKRILISANISPDYCFRTLINNNGSSTSATLIGMRNDNEEAKYSYTAGLNFCYNISKRFGIELGAQYSNKGYQTKKSSLTFGDMIDPRKGFVYDTTYTGHCLPVSGQFIYNYNYLDIPLRALFSFGKKKIHFMSSIGITTNILLKATETSVLECEDGSKDKHTQTSNYDYNKLNFSPTISAGIDWKFNSKMGLRVEPTFRYGLLKIIDAPVSAYLWSAGLNISYYFGMK